MAGMYGGYGSMPGYGMGMGMPRMQNYGMGGGLGKGGGYGAPMNPWGLMMRPGLGLQIPGNPYQYGPQGPNSLMYQYGFGTPWTRAEKKAREGMLAGEGPLDLSQYYGDMLGGA